MSHRRASASRSGCGSGGSAVAEASAQPSVPGYVGGCLRHTRNAGPPGAIDQTRALGAEQARGEARRFARVVPASPPLAEPSRQVAASVPASPAAATAPGGCASVEAVVLLAEPTYEPAESAWVS